MNEGPLENGDSTCIRGCTDPHCSSSDPDLTVKKYAKARQARIFESLSHLSDSKIVFMCAVRGIHVGKRVSKRDLMKKVIDEAG